MGQNARFLGKFHAMYNISLQKLLAEWIAQAKNLEVSSAHFKPGWKLMFCMTLLPMENNANNRVKALSHISIISASLNKHLRKYLLREKMSKRINK